MNVEIDLSNWLEHRDAKVDLYLDPEGSEDGIRIYSCSVVGSTIPRAAYNRLHLHLARVQQTTDREELALHLSSHTDQLCEIAALYRGARWDGNNHRGLWDDRAIDLIQQFGDEISDRETWDWAASES